MVRLPRLLCFVLAALLAGAGFGAEPAEIATLRAKAEQGNSLAQYNLGLAYATGQQVTINHAEAFAWLSLAAENGTTGRALDDLLANLTDQQLTEGRQRFAQYRAAISARAAQASAARDAGRRTGPRGFSLTPVTPAKSEPTPGAVLPHPPESAEPPAPSNPATLEAENARLRTELTKAQAQLREQAATIERLTKEARAAGSKPAP